MTRVYWQYNHIPVDMLPESIWHLLTQLHGQTIRVTVMNLHEDFPPYLSVTGELRACDIYKTLQVFQPDAASSCAMFRAEHCTALFELQDGWEVYVKFD